ncbi:hypothetical protein J6590_044586 [Homalodisca vitripennis]|nr:hypothetical protein J6590_044586 [Homalodisca vitripennis]
MIISLQYLSSISQCNIITVDSSPTPASAEVALGVGRWRGVGLGARSIAGESNVPARDGKRGLTTQLFVSRGIRIGFRSYPTFCVTRNKNGVLVQPRYLHYGESETYFLQTLIFMPQETRIVFWSNPAVCDTRHETRILVKPSCQRHDESESHYVQPIFLRHQESESRSGPTQLSVTQGTRLVFWSNLAVSVTMNRNPIMSSPSFFVTSNQNRVLVQPSCLCHKERDSYSGQT